jgi:hypothetical protein
VLAIAYNVSPRFTRCVTTRTSSAASAVVVWEALTSTGVASTARGVEASSGADGARGISRRWPGRTAAFTETPLASARSPRDTPSFLAIEANDSRRRTVWNLSADSSETSAATRRADRVGPVPAGTLTSYSGYRSGVVHRRNSGFNAWISSMEAPVHSATRLRSTAPATRTLSYSRASTGGASNPYWVGFFAMMTAARIIGTYSRVSRGRYRSSDVRSQKSSTPDARIARCTRPGPPL